MPNDMDGRPPNRNNDELLIRMDERTRVIGDMTKALSDDVKILKGEAVTKSELAQLSTSIVTKEEFAPIRLVVYGMVAIILTSVVGALVAVVLGQH